jgi:hypothetical protein
MAAVIVFAYNSGTVIHTGMRFDTDVPLGVTMNYSRSTKEFDLY